jgi:hypothetical protein
MFLTVAKEQTFLCPTFPGRFEFPHPSIRRIIMKLKAILPALLLAAAVSLSFSASAATDADKTQAVEAQTDKPAVKAKKMKPHSHMQEKTGVPQSMPSAEAAEGNPKAAQDMSKHFHPRDGK